MDESETLSQQYWNVSQAGNSKTMIEIEKDMLDHINRAEASLRSLEFELKMISNPSPKWKEKM